MSERTCENCKKNVTYMKDRTKCVECANGVNDAFEPIPKVTVNGFNTGGLMAIMAERNRIRNSKVN